MAVQSLVDIASNGVSCNFGYLVLTLLAQWLERPSHDLLVNFMVGLLESIGYNAIIVCVNRLTKIRHFVLTINKITAEGTANLIINNVYRLHGFSNIVVLDCGPQFNSLF